MTFGRNSPSNEGENTVRSSKDPAVIRLSNQEIEINLSSDSEKMSSPESEPDIKIENQRDQVLISKVPPIPIGRGWIINKEELLKEVRERSKKQEMTTKNAKSKPK